MKAVLMSIKPKWCELIASGEKIVEVRKSKPKLETPFKVYIYCTVDGGAKGDRILPSGITCGKVIGEFECDLVDEIGYSPEMHGKYISDNDDIHYVSCVNFEQMFDYLADGYGYGWNISNLVIYEKPRELSEFYAHGECTVGKKCEKCAWFKFETETRAICTLEEDYKPFTRPPQSWCYVEEQK